MRNYYIIQEVTYPHQLPKRTRVLFKGHSKTLDDFCYEGRNLNDESLKKILGSTYDSLEGFDIHTLITMNNYLDISSVSYRKRNVEETNPEFNFKLGRFDRVKIPIEGISDLFREIFGIPEPKREFFKSYEEAEASVRESLNKTPIHLEDDAKKEWVDKLTKELLKYYPK